MTIMDRLLSPFPCCFVVCLTLLPAQHAGSQSYHTGKLIRADVEISKNREPNLESFAEHICLLVYTNLDSQFRDLNLHKLLESL